MILFSNGCVFGFAEHGQLIHSRPWCAKICSIKLDITFDSADERNPIVEQMRIRSSGKNNLNTRSGHVDSY